MEVFGIKRFLPSSAARNFPPLVLNLIRIEYRNPHFTSIHIYRATAQDAYPGIVVHMMVDLVKSLTKNRRRILLMRLLRGGRLHRDHLRGWCAYGRVTMESYDSARCEECER